MELSLAKRGPQSAQARKASDEAESATRRLRKILTDILE
jgi:hypothetical protein